MSCAFGCGVWLGTFDTEMIVHHRGIVCVPVEIVMFAVYSSVEDVKTVVYVFICKLTPVGGVMGGNGVRAPNEGCVSFLNEPVVPPFHVRVFQDREGSVRECETSTSEFC